MRSSTDVRNHESDGKTAFRCILLVPVIWGAGFPLTHNAVALVEPGLFAFSRSLIGMLVLLPFAWPALLADRTVVLGGLMLGAFNGISIVAAGYALQDLNSATTAFVVTLNIVFVPFIFLFLKMGRISSIDILSVILGLTGAYIVFGSRLEQISPGYLWALLAAFSIALNLCLIGKLTRDRPDINRMALSFYQTLFTTVGLLYFPCTQDLTPLKEAQVWCGVIYLGAFCTALAAYLQMRFQNAVGSARSAVIFNLDLVFASLFGLLNREWLSGNQILGGAIIFLASMLESVAAGVKARWEKREYIAPPSSRC